jgi:type VI secretion system protein ImpA
MINPIQHIIQAFKGGGTEALPASVAEWLKPISEAQPCGETLEYDGEYAVLAARLSPKADVQYGQFSSQPEPPNWTEVEKDGRRLLLRRKDISVLIWFTRARTRTAGAAGLLEGLSALQAVLQAYPEQVHPQRMIDGELDPAVRANALAALCDPEGLLDDVREVLVSGSTAFRLTVRDIERAFAVPRAAYGPEPEQVHRQLRDLRERKDPVLLALTFCLACVQAVAQWSADQLGDDAPELKPLLKLLHNLDPPRESATRKVQAESVQPSHGAVQASGAVVLQTLQAISHPAMTLPDHGQAADQREHIRALLSQVRVWIEHNEPSSPVSVLLKQAERMWGKRFSEVAGEIPPELLQAWDRD